MSTRKLDYGRGDIIADKYEIVDLLDESPLGLMYRAKHNKSGKYVRLLMLRPSIAGRDERESIISAFKTTREMEHATLMKVGELGEHDGMAFFTMEDFEGSSLRDLLQEYKVAGKQFALKEAAQITIQILEGLSVFHSNGLVHRAIRPENVVVKIRYTGPRRQNFVAQVKLVGGAFWDMVPTAVLAEDEFTRGEAQYLGPELKSFDPTPTERSDVYSAGVIFYEMLVGTAPVGTFQLPRTRRPDLPSHVDDVVELALAQAPEDRYQTAQDFVTDVQRTFDETALGEEDARPLISPLGWGVAFLSVALIAVIGYNFRTDPEQAALAKDSQVRASVVEQHAKPTPEEFQAIQSQNPNMLYVPAGPYVSGRLHAEESSLVGGTEPRAEVVEVGAFLIDAFEYPNLKDDAPKYEMTFLEAEAACEAAGKRMCSSAEWEKACKGPMNYVYSYGDTFDPSFCGEGLDSPAYPAGSRSECRSGWGVFDLSGNFREWTSTAAGKSGNRRVVRGGQRGNAAKGTRCAAAVDLAVGYRDKTLSFRCCKDVN